MKKKETVRLRKLANAIAFNKPPQEKKKIYKRLKSIHKANKKRA